MAYAGAAGALTTFIGMPVCAWHMLGMCMACAWHVHSLSGWRSLALTLPSYHPSTGGGRALRARDHELHRIPQRP
eukprot:scaffold94441_cov24-Phaeocystis_antarctica.AAC.1